jgi:hypothetical protein
MRALHRALDPVAPEQVCLLCVVFGLWSFHCLTVLCTCFLCCDSAALRILFGHMCLSRKNYSYALDQFLRVYQTNTASAPPPAAVLAATPSKPSETTAAGRSSADQPPASAAAASSSSSSSASDSSSASAASASAKRAPAPVYGYQRSPQLNLFCAIASLHHALNKNTVDRHHGIVRAFAFFFNYYT